MENIVRKEEIACNKQFLLFSLCFLPYMVLIFHFKCTLKCRLQFVSILTSLKFCRLVNGLTCNETVQVSTDERATHLSVASGCHLLHTADAVNKSPTSKKLNIDRRSSSGKLKKRYKRQIKVTFPLLALHQRTKFKLIQIET